MRAGARAGAVCDRRVAQAGASVRCAIITVGIVARWPRRASLYSPWR